MLFDFFLDAHINKGAKHRAWLALFIKVQHPATNLNPQPLALTMFETRLAIEVGQSPRKMSGNFAPESQQIFRMQQGLPSVNLGGGAGRRIVTQECHANLIDEQFARRHLPLPGSGMSAFNNSL